MVAWWLALLPQSNKFPGLDLSRGLSVWSLHVLPVLVWVFSGYPSFLPQSKDMDVRLISGSELPVGVIVSDRLHVALQWTGDLSRVYPWLSAKESWDRVQQTPVTLNRTKQVLITDE